MGTHSDIVWHLGEGPSADTRNFKKWKKLPSRAAAGCIARLSSMTTAT